jgi:hypothetical protein
MYTVKAFKPFELISEDVEDLSQAEERFEQLVRDPAIDAAYVFKDGELVHAWADNYDLPEGGEEYILSYVRHESISSWTPERVDLFPLYTYVVPEGKEPWQGDFQPLGHSSPRNHIEQYQIRSVDENGKFQSIPETDEMSYGAARWIQDTLYDLYHIARLVQAARHTVHADALFAEEILTEVQGFLLEMLGRESIPSVQEIKTDEAQ